MLEEKKLEDLVDNYNFQRVPLSSSQRENLEKIYPYYGAQGIIDYVEDYIFDGEFILVAEDGENLKSQKNNVCTFAKGKFWVNNHAHIIKANSENDNKYIFYKLNQIDFKRFVTGSAQPKLTKDNLNSIKLNVHKFAEQQKIASVLSTLDGKIALNNQINATLEQMAKTLYDYWFVQFDFPDENGKPYKTSGGEMVYNETLKRDIPKGWEVKKLSEIANLKAGGDKPSEFSDIPTEDLTVPIFSNGIINDGLYGYTNSSTIKKPSITISARGTIGFSKIRMNPFVPIIRLISITPIEEFFLKYLEQFFKDMDFENSGSVQQQLTVPQIKDLAILLPSEKTLNKFHGITLNGLLQIENNNEQIIELTKLRDWLLPMLMNGQVTVK